MRSLSPSPSLLSSTFTSNTYRIQNVMGCLLTTAKNCNKNQLCTATSHPDSQQLNGSPDYTNPTLLQQGYIQNFSVPQTSVSQPHTKVTSLTSRDQRDSLQAHLPNLEMLLIKNESLSLEYIANQATHMRTPYFFSNIPTNIIRDVNLFLRSNSKYLKATFLITWINSFN